MIVARGLDGRLASGMGLAIGAAFGEGIYAFLAFLGFSTLLSEIPWVLTASKGIAVPMLCVPGIHFLRWSPSIPEMEAPGDIKKGFILGFAIAILNPTFLATWSAAVAILFSSELIDFEPYLAFPFAAASVFGIVTWFLILLRLVRRIASVKGAGMGWLVATVKAMGLFLLLAAAWFAWQFFGS